MSMEFKHLRKFTPDQIVFNDDEVREILDFFFPAEKSRIKAFAMTDHVREFAQGLLLEAIDASYALGWVQIVFSVFEGIFYKQPTTSLKKVIKKFAKKAAKHWFKHFKNITDLSHIQIYEIVRIQLNQNFSTTMALYLNGTMAKAKKGTAGAFVDYASKAQTHNKIIWVC